MHYPAAAVYLVNVVSYYGLTARKKSTAGNKKGLPIRSHVRWTYFPYNCLPCLRITNVAISEM